MKTRGRVLRSIGIPLFVGVISAVTATSTSFAVDSVGPRAAATSAAPRSLPPRWRPFGPTSVWNTPATVEPGIDRDSRALAALLSDPSASRIASFGEFGVSVYEAGPTTPRYSVVVTNEPAWGTNELSGTKVPIPDGAVPAPGSDGKLVIIDRARRKVYDLWQARLVDGTWQASWGGVYALEGAGTSPRPGYVGKYSVPWSQPVSRATGAGVSSLAGLIRVEEVQEGVINHALAFATDRACGPAQTGSFRFPATTTDGVVVNQPCIPQGAWVQLDPSIDVDASPRLSDFEKVLAKALQRYGAYCVDNSEARMAFVMEWPKDGWGRVYVDAGLPSNYYNMAELPWQGLRVLKAPKAVSFHAE